MSSSSARRRKFGAFLNSDQEDDASNAMETNDTSYNCSYRKSNASDYSVESSSSPWNNQFHGLNSRTAGNSPLPEYFMSPYIQTSPFTKSPWTAALIDQFGDAFAPNGLIGTMVREEGHVYSLAASGEVLYTGSDSKNIRIWKNLEEFSGFKSSSGLVKAIVISNGKIYTGHQDGKIRIWRVSSKDPSVHKRVGSLPNFKEFVTKSFNPKNYVEVRRKRNVLRIRHYDAVSCMSLNEELGLLYSGSWDRTVKVWRVSDSKCVESIDAHDDAVNSVAAGFDGLAFSGSADGTVKVWRREVVGNKFNKHGQTKFKHALFQTLLKQDFAVTSVAVDSASRIVYCGSSDGLVNFWEGGKQGLSHGGVLRGHKLAVLCLAAAGNLVFSGGADKSICVWRRDEGGAHSCLSVLTGHNGPVKCLAVVKEETRLEENGTKGDDQRWILYSGSLDKSVMVWRVSGKTPDFRLLQGA
uniref:Uncharacterized protein n=1 Tax=Kalanchoe fedtschenkoi TaxID=63787 RepID=A0A7N0TDV6_KALFE